MEDLFRKLKDKKILLLGLGREGFSSYKWLRKAFPKKLLGVADGNLLVKEKLVNDSFLEFHLGNDYLTGLKEYDLIFKSPGISLKDVHCADKEKITSQTDLFLQFYGKQTIGVTGTKGKSTTASLITHILKENNKRAILLGNIGIPPLDRIDEIDKDAVAVFEMSAHQLEYVHHSPKVAVLLNIFPEHLDHFNGFEAYKTAKLNITKFLEQDDLLVASNKLSSELTKVKSVIKYFENEADILPEALNLKGAHNLNNVKAAILAVQPFGIDAVSAFKAATTFKPLPHRLEYLGVHGGIRFYNDSISTIPESAIAAIQAVGKVDTLILGGFDRGLDFSKLVGFLESHPVNNLIFTGPAGKKMIALIQNDDKIASSLFEVANLKQAFEVIKKVTPLGGVCLLSPAAASYDEFHNFEHRGDAFKQLALQL